MKASEGLGLAPYDSADCLRDEAAITAHLQAVMAKDAEDPAWQSELRHRRKSGEGAGLPADVGVCSNGRGQ